MLRREEIGQVATSKLKKKLDQGGFKYLDVRSTSLDNDITSDVRIRGRNWRHRPAKCRVARMSRDPAGDIAEATGQACKPRGATRWFYQLLVQFQRRGIISRLREHILIEDEK
jgi:hypothetical protein